MTLLPPQLGQLGVLIAEYTVSLTGTRPTVGLIYVGLAKAIAGTPTAIACSTNWRTRITPCDGDHTADPLNRLNLQTRVYLRTGRNGANSGEVYLVA